MPSFLRNRHAAVLSAVLLFQAAAFYWMPQNEVVPPRRPFQEFPTEIAGWRMVADQPLEEEVQEFLKADDILNRFYLDPTGATSVGFFVAFYRTQRAGVSPHSPRVCLPGSGWEIRQARTLAIQLPGRSEPVYLNRHLVARDVNRSLVLYWYQSHGRLTASEYRAKLYLMLDSLRMRRSDTAIVRIVAPVLESEDAAERTAVAMVRAFFPVLVDFLP